MTKSSLAVLGLVALLGACEGPPESSSSASSEEVSVVKSAVLQGNPSAPVYDTAGDLCAGVAPMPPPVPGCQGYYDNCSLETQMNGVCVLSRVVCPYCPMTMPMPSPA